MDNSVRVWSAVTGECEQTLVGHSDYVNSAHFSVDGQKIVSASDDKSVRVWSAVTGECEQTLVGHSDRVWSAHFSPDGLKIVSASADRSGVRVWSAATGEQIQPRSAAWHLLCGGGAARRPAT
jgi:WD40 repeat protein